MLSPGAVRNKAWKDKAIGGPSFLAHVAVSVPQVSEASATDSKTNKEYVDGEFPLRIGVTGLVLGGKAHCEIQLLKSLCSN